MASTPPISESGSDTLANALLPSLTAGKSFTIPIIDLAGAEYALPTVPPAIAPAQLTNEDLTTREVGGDGTFDAFMASTNAHLKAEYDKGRITGEQYTRAYIELTQAAISGSVQYLLGRDQAYWQSVNSQLQAQVIQLQVVENRVNLQIAKTKLNMIQFDALTAEANYALAKLKLATEDAQHSLLTTQQDGAVIDNNTKAYNLANILPQQLEVLEEQVLSSQKDNQIKDFNLTQMLPIQKAATQEQLEQVRAQTLNTRTDGVTVAGVIGKQKELYAQQVTSYKRDAEVKAAKIFSDAWVTMKTIDEGLFPPEGFKNTSLDVVLTGLKNNIGFGTSSPDGGGGGDPAGPVMTGATNNGDGTTTIHYLDGSFDTVPTLQP